MKNLPLLAAPLAFALLACAPCQAATATCQFPGTNPQGDGNRGTNMTDGEFNMPWIGDDTGTNQRDVNDNKLTFGVIPEPTAAALGAVGLLLLLRVRRND